MTASHGNILITDDDPDLLRALRSTLHSLGFEIAEAANGEQALKQIREHHFDVILLDINMPGIGGIETCREDRDETRLRRPHHPRPGRPANRSAAPRAQ